MGNSPLAMLVGIGVALAPITLAAPANATPPTAAQHFTAETLSNGSAEHNLAETTGAMNTGASAGTLIAVNESTLLLKLAPGVSVDFTAGTISQNGATEQLPTETVDANGSPIRLEYFAAHGGIEIHLELKYQDRDLARCLVGISGGSITGATAGGYGGAAAGTVTVPVIGTVGGGVVGAILGAIGGGLTGAAAFCWA